MFTVRTFSKKGFTLIELMVVVAVIAILATIALVGLSGTQKGARDTQRLATMNGIRTALERYNSNNGSYITNSSFVSVASILLAQSYLSNAFDPGCGTATVNLTNITAGGAAATYTDANGSWTPCTGGASPSYSYGWSGGAYSLYLVKESGGSSLLKGPQ